MGVWGKSSWLRRECLRKRAEDECSPGNVAHLRLITRSNVARSYNYHLTGGLKRFTDHKELKIIYLLTKYPLVTTE